MLNDWHWQLTDYIVREHFRFLEASITESTVQKQNWSFLFLLYPLNIYAQDRWNWRISAKLPTVNAAILLAFTNPVYLKHWALFNVSKG